MLRDRRPFDKDFEAILSWVPEMDPHLARIDLYL